jgi:hypothetical protein
MRTAPESPHCCTHCSCPTPTEWVLKPELRLIDFDEAVELGVISPYALAVPLREPAA